MKDNFPEYMHVRNTEPQSLVHMTSPEHLKIHSPVSTVVQSIHFEPEKSQPTDIIAANTPYKGL